MVREIIKNDEDRDFLTQKSEPFLWGLDNHIIQNLLDTAEAHKERCAGLAAPQIGKLKRVVVVRMGNEFVPLINPVIIKKSTGFYYTMEGCLSLDGQHNVKRHHTILVSYTAKNGKNMVRQFSGRIAQIIQHEVDHLNGILIGKEV